MGTEPFEAPYSIRRSGRFRVAGVIFQGRLHLTGIKLQSLSPILRSAILSQGQPEGIEPSNCAYFEIPHLPTGFLAQSAVCGLFPC
jgi:hypothetical protein